MSKHGPAPNDQRSSALNPNDPAHRASQDNRSRQLNPNDDAYRSSRGQPSRSDERPDANGTIKKQ